MEPVKFPGPDASIAPDLETSSNIVDVGVPDVDIPEVGIPDFSPPEIDLPMELFTTPTSVRRPHTDVEEVKAELNRAAHKLVSGLSKVLPKGILDSMYGEGYVDSLPQGLVPKEYRYARKTPEGWVNEYEEKMPEIPKDWREFRDPEGEDEKPWTQKLVETLLGEISRPDKWIPSLFTGSPKEKKETVEKLLKGFPLYMYPEASQEAFKGGKPIGDTMGERAISGIPLAFDLAAAGLAAGGLKGFTKGMLSREVAALSRGGGKLPPAAVMSIINSQAKQARAEASVILNQVVKFGNYPPRLIYRALQKVIPVPLKNNIEGVWENIFVPAGGGFREAASDLGEAYYKGVQKATSARVIPDIFGSGEGRKSLSEVFQPAVERLTQTKIGNITLDQPFRTSQAHRALVQKIADDISEKIASGGAKSRFEAMKQLRGMSSGEIDKEILAGMKKYKIRPSYQKSLLDSLKTTILKPRGKGETIPSNEELLNLPGVDIFLSDIDSLISGSAKPYTIQKTLKKAIKNESLPVELRALARDLHNLPYDSAMAVGEASKKASREFISESIRRLGVAKTHVTPEEMPYEYMKSSFPGLNGLFVPRDVELELRALETIPKIAHRTWNKWFLTPWKTAKVIMQPATHLRNTISNVILNDWGGLPFYRADVYLKAAQDMKSGGKYWREWEKLTGGGGTFSLSDLDEITKGLRYPSNMMDHALGIFDKIAAKPRAWYNAEEQWAKMAKFIWNQERGMSPRESALDAMKWTFNYGEITRATAQIRGSTAPFFTWQSKVLPLMAETAVKHPVRFGKWWVFYEALQNQSLHQMKISNDEWSYINNILPEYIKEGQYLLVPWRDNKDRLQLLNLTYMIPGFGDIAEMYGTPSGWLLGHPLLSIAGAIQSKTTFSGAPLYFDWEDNSTKLAKIFSYVLKMAAPIPSYFPGGTNWESIWKTIQQHPEAMTWQQQVSSQAGFKIQPVDLVQSARQHRAVTNIHRAQIGSQMKKELRGATSERDVERIVQKYSKYRRSLVNQEED